MVTPTNPGSVLFGSTRQAILALVFLRPDESFYLREIVRRTGRGTGAVQRELKQLAQCGILRRDRDRFFRANPDSPIYEPLKELVVRTVGLGDRLRDALRPVTDDVVVAFIFGSFARRGQQEGSDVDVLVVTRDDHLTLERVDGLLVPVQERIGREINPFVLTIGEWRTKWESESPFIRRVSGGEKIFLIGDDDELKRLAEERVAPLSCVDAAGGRRLTRAGRPRPAKRKGQGARR